MSYARVMPLDLVGVGVYNELGNVGNRLNANVSEVRVLRVQVHDDQDGRACGVVGATAMELNKVIEREKGEEARSGVAD